VSLIYIFVYQSNTKKMNLNSSSRFSAHIHQTLCRDQWNVSLWVPAVTQCQSHKERHVGILYRRLRLLRERSDRAAKCSARFIYRLTNDPVFNDVPRTIQMGQFAVNPEIQSWRDYRLSLCSDQLLQTWLQSMRHTWHWRWPWSGKKMTEREKAVAAPETHFLFKDNFSCLFLVQDISKAVAI